MKGFGLAHVATGTPIAPETAFRVASVSKMFTAAAVLMLVEEGELSLDDDARPASQTDHRTSMTGVMPLTLA